MDNIFSLDFWQGALEPVIIALLFGIAGLGQRPLTNKISILVDVYSSIMMGLLVHILVCATGEAKYRYVELSIAALAGLAGPIIMARLYEMSANLILKFFRDRFMK